MLVMLGETAPTTVKEEHEMPEEQDADDVATWYGLPEDAAMSPDSEPITGSVENVCVPVHVFGLARLMPSVLPAVVRVELFER